MNQAAYDECRLLWTKLHTLEPEQLQSLPDEVRALARRVANRSELRLVVAETADVRRMPPGTFVAMGTSGLKPTELRAVLHAMQTASPPGAASQRLATMLLEKVTPLQDYQPSESPPWYEQLGIENSSSSGQQPFGSTSSDASCHPVSWSATTTTSRCAASWSASTTSSAATTSSTAAYSALHLPAVAPSSATWAFGFFAQHCDRKGTKLRKQYW